MATREERIVTILTALSPDGAKPSDARVSAVLNAFAAGYAAAIGGGIPQTLTVPQKRGLFLRVVARFIREVVQADAANTAIEEARLKAIADIDAEWGEEEKV